MLFNLKKNVSNSLKLKPSIFGGLSRFDPFLIPSYQAGYLMNLTTDNPSGSINATALSQWFDATVLSIASKYLQANVATVPVVVNGFNCFAFDGVLTEVRVGLNDLFTGISNYTFMIGFQRGTSAGTNHIIFYQANTAHTQETWLNIQPGGTLDFLLGDGYGGSGTNISATTIQTYDDNLPHVIICQVDQTLKTVDIYTDKGEHITNSNPAFNGSIMTTTSPFDVYFGRWYLNQFFLTPGGILFDMFLYSSILNTSSINALFNYECSRLGIAFIPF